MILAQGIYKNFGQFEAVRDLSFEVDRGEVLGFIGPNGAGKTTTMRILTGYLPATEGRAVVAGFDVFEDPMSVRKKVGYLPETPPLYTDLSIGAYLRFVAEIRGVSRSDRIRRVGEVMDRVGLSGWERRIIGSLSKGYRQRVGLAQAIVHEPEVLILDEPTSGLDPAQVVGIREFISELAQERTVILSTHILSEVEILCDRAVVIGGGSLLAADTLDGLRNRVGEGVRYRVSLSVPEEELGEVATGIGSLDAVDRVTPVDSADGLVVLDMKAPTDPRARVAALAVEKGWSLHALERIRPTLEEAFLTIVSEEKR